jgi:adenylate kinase family enzyme
MRALVFGNSGSGKSTWARALSERHGLTHLDLDTLVWEPDQVAVTRPSEVVMAELQAFLNDHDRWVIEGCYGELVAAAAPHCSLLVFLDPGREACLANNRRRPWEPHKYASPEAQDAMREALQAWVCDYYERDDHLSWRRHHALFEAHPGPKWHWTGPPPLPPG